MCVCAHCTCVYTDAIVYFTEDAVQQFCYFQVSMITCHNYSMHYHTHMHSLSLLVLGGLMCTVVL